MLFQASICTLLRPRQAQHYYSIARCVQVCWTIEKQEEWCVVVVLLFKCCLKFFNLLHVGEVMSPMQRCALPHNLEMLGKKSQKELSLFLLCYY